MRNIIVMLRDSEGRWINQANQIKQMVLRFYKNLFKEENIDISMINTSLSFPFMNEIIRSTLLKNPRPTEVRQAIVVIETNKVTKIDGLPALFY